MTELEEIKKLEIEVNRDLLMNLIQVIDLTSLSSTDNEKSIQKLIDKANAGFEGVFPGAVCIYANFGEYVKSQLNNRIKTAVVAASFPTGQTILNVKKMEVSEIKSPDEIDVVINRGQAIDNDFDQIEMEISTLRKACPNKILKVILETGELKNQDLIRKSASSAIKGGADFIKTSTGKMVDGADPESVINMCHVIKEHYENTGIKVGIKPSGGIRSVEDAVLYYKIVKSILGDDWLNPKLFRIGASSLYDNLVLKLNE